MGSHTYTSMKKIHLVVLVLAAILTVLWFVFYPHTVQAPVQTLVSTYTNASPDTIVVASPKPGESVAGAQSIAVTGQARGPWYFEASFPVVIEDLAGNVLGQTPATATSDWMTENFVPFTANISLSSSYRGPATIILKNDNPSGDPSRAASVSVPIVIQ